MSGRAWIVIGAIIAVIVAVGAVGGMLSLRPDAGDAAPTASAPSASPTAEESFAPLTVAQELAVDAARSSLGSLGVSRRGLVQQLVEVGYSTEDAELAVDRIDAHWKNEASTAANRHLNTGSFTSSELRNQLSFEGFAEPEIDYALAAMGR
ncbi:Ltp family lipoprotein [Microbacterium sp.]|uniref:Ltp family lipoprotein n=1 Tax=Microbacterium sp. TaxID=51671 RepID=UPI003A8E0750